MRWLFIALVLFPSFTFAYDKCCFQMPGKKMGEAGYCVQSLDGTCDPAATPVDVDCREIDACNVSKTPQQDCCIFSENPSKFGPTNCATVPSLKECDSGNVKTSPANCTDLPECRSDYKDYGLCCISSTDSTKYGPTNCKIVSSGNECRSKNVKLSDIYANCSDLPECRNNENNYIQKLITPISKSTCKEIGGYCNLIDPTGTYKCRGENKGQMDCPAGDICCIPDNSPRCCVLSSNPKNFGPSNCQGTYTSCSDERNDSCGNLTECTSNVSTLTLQQRSDLDAKIVYYHLRILAIILILAFLPIGHFVYSIIAAVYFDRFNRISMRMPEVIETLKRKCRR